MGVLGVALFAILASSPSIGAQTRRLREIEVKAAYLLNFGRFVRWPRASLPPSAPFGVCVLGADPFGAVLDATLGGELIDGHPVVARRAASAADAAGCQIVYLATLPRRELAATVSDLAKWPMLTVSDQPQFVDAGGMVQFVTIDGRVRFELNATAAERGGLMFNSELARVAFRVRRVQP